MGNTIDGCQAEYVLEPDAMATLAAAPDDLSDEQVLMCPDIMSTGFGGAERAGIRIGDTVSGFAQGPIGLCAAAGAKLSGATAVIGVDSLGNRLQVARRRGAHHAIESSRIDPVDAIITLCPGGEERMRRLMWVIQSGRADLSPIVTHRFELDHIEKAYDLSVHQHDGVL